MTVRMALVGLLASTLTTSAIAQKAVPAPVPVPAPSQVRNATPTSSIFADMQKASLADLQVAMADAKTTGDAVASRCYEAWIALTELQQTAAAAPSTSSGLPPVPGAGVITQFQRQRDIVLALRKGAPLKVACAPLAEEMKMDVMTLLGKLATGTVIQ